MDLDLDKEDIELLSDLLTIRDEQQHAMVNIGWVVRMFFAEPWTKPVREAISVIAKEYMQLVGEHLKWTKHVRTGQMHKIGTGRVKFPWEWIPEYEDENEVWGFGYHGGEGDEDASSFLINALGGRKSSTYTGYLEIYFPLAWFAEHGGRLQNLVLGWAKRLRPLSGYGSIGAQPPLDADGMRRSMFLVRRLSERFPGLDVGNAISENITVMEFRRRGGYIKGPSWLTVLCDAYVRELGGVDELKARLGEEFPITTYDGGLMIQAGPRPDVGDVERNRWPRHLIQLSKVLRPIRSQRHSPIHGWGYKDHPTMDFDVTKAWIERFDDK
jgi:hypothetical protein